MHFSILLLAIIGLLSCSTEIQPPPDYVSLQKIATLPKELAESSGVARADSTSYFLHNDSGNKARLYQVSSTTGEILRQMKVKDAKNHDWEELAEDSLYVYIGDFGNNAGLRDNLVILQVLKKDLLEKEEVEANRIEFDYPNRPKKLSGRHNYDCESMVLIRDSLYLFSKNRGDLATDVYRIPATPGKYTAEHIGHFNTKGLVTGADFLEGPTNTLVLLGYEIQGDAYRSFFWTFSDFQGTDFFGGKQQRREISPNLQGEAILFDSDSTVVITNEEEKGGLGNMNRLFID